MAIRFVEIHAATDPEQLNTEWLVIENDGKLPFNTRGCGMTVSRKGQKKRSELGIIDPGFVLHANEKMRLVSGSPAKKTQGTPPDPSDVKNYHLFLKEPMLSRPGMVVRIALKQLELAKATFEQKK